MISGLFGAGGGLMFLLVLMIVLQFPTYMAIGTSSLIMAITATSETLGYAFQSNVDFSSGIIITVAAVTGGLLSARLGHRKKSESHNGNGIRLPGCGNGHLEVEKYTLRYKKRPTAGRFFHLERVVAKHTSIGR
jgi:hypothetical protein